MTPFVVLAMPRSMTFWLSCFLSYNGRRVDHDASRFFTCRADIGRYFLRGGSMTDTALGAIWHDVCDAMPSGLRVAVVHRHPDQVNDSLDRCGLHPVPWLHDYAARLDRIDGQHYEFGTLTREPYISSLFEYCLGVPFDQRWWRQLRNINLQADIPATLADVERNLSGIRAVFGTARPAPLWNP